MCFRETVLNLQSLTSQSDCPTKKVFPAAKSCLTAVSRDESPSATVLSYMLFRWQSNSSSLEKPEQERRRHFQPLHVKTTLYFQIKAVPRRWSISDSLSVLTPPYLLLSLVCRFPGFSTVGCCSASLRLFWALTFRRATFSICRERLIIFIFCFTGVQWAPPVGHGKKWKTQKRKINSCKT